MRRHGAGLQSQYSAPPRNILTAWDQSKDILKTPLTRSVGGSAAPDILLVDGAHALVCGISSRGVDPPQPESDFWATYFFWLVFFPFPKVSPPEG